ncbi:MAG: LysR family transcriptional regulator [Hyphomicrobiaceae bacterium]
MQVFSTVIDTGGLAAAGRKLGMSPPTVTRIIGQLESHLGTRLLVRTTRIVKPTTAGVRFSEDCRRILSDIAEATASASGAHATPSGMLTVTAPVQFGQTYVMPVLLDYLDRHPKVRARAVFVDRVVNLIEEGIDVAVRIGELPDSSARVVKVGAVRRIVCAAPSYLARMGLPRSPADLAKHRLIAITTDSTLNWRFVRHAPTQKLEATLASNSIRAAIRATEEGWGISQLLSYQVADQLRTGQLVRILKEFERDPVPVAILHTEGRHAQAKVRAFVDLVVERLRRTAEVREEDERA